MSKINAIMDMGKRSLMNSQSSLQTVGHNIASKSVEGYSRQRVDQVTNLPIGEGKLRIGMGAKSAAVTRVNNPYLEKQIGNERGQLGYLTGKQDAMTRVESIYNEQVNKGLNQYMSEFFNAFRELSNNPESLATRSMVKETAQYVTKDFKRINSQLTGIQSDLDQQIKTHVNEINGFTSEVASLNEKIQSVELTGATANDERDRRDLLVKKIGEKVNIRWAEGEDGTVTISAGNNALLVAGNDARELYVQSTGETDKKGEGNYDIMYKNSERATPYKVTEQLHGGAIGGLLEVRDGIITELKGGIDEMAYNLSSSINEIHQQGFNSYNETGVDFFEQPDNVKHAADLMTVNEDILKDVSRISAGAKAESPGDNRVANQIAGLQYDKIMSDGNANVDEYYNSMVGRVGVITRKTNSAHDAQDGIVKQLSSIRESISGVSLDEETTKMIEFQKAFDAAARIVKTADEMMDTVLNLKKL
jgi:flagellar hook-associated protein 1 FlgK